jgi:DegV family protein with EDD domain
MSKVAIVTDSTAYIPPELVQKYNITVAPQILIWSGETFQDGVDIQPDEFYRRLQKATIMPSSSQVSPATFKDIFENLLAKDHDILAILISSKLSGTVDSAVQACESFPKSRIEIVDSLSTAMGMGFHVLAAAETAETGGNLAECKAIAEKARDRTGVFFTVDTLEFLYRGGRIGGGIRFFGTALSIKPILELRNGELEAVERVRTRRRALDRLVDLVEDRIAGRKPVRLACLHANASEDARSILDQINKKVNATQTIFSEVSPVIGTHVGPGTVGLAYMVEI